MKTNADKDTFIIGDEFSMKDHFSETILDRIDNTEYKPTQFIAGVEPKIKCKIAFIQKILIKLFGQNPVFETRMAKTIHISPVENVVDVNVK